MRRIVSGSILFGWIAFLAGVVVRGMGLGEHGLLQEMQFILMESPAFSLSLEAARAVITAVVVMALTIALWAMMFALATDRAERDERLMSLAAAFSFVLVVSAVAQLVAIIAGAPHVLAMLFAVQMATLLSMLAAGGVELAWHALVHSKAGEEVDPGQQAVELLPALRRRLAVMRTVANDRGPQ